MTIYEKMIEELSATNIYNLKKGTRSEAEICCYASELEWLDRRIDELFESGFVSSIVSPTMHNFCRLFCLPENMGIITLRELVTARTQITNRDFTKAGIKRCIKALGFDATLTEAFSTGTVRITITSDKHTYSSHAESELHIKALLPPHLTPIFTWSV